MNVNELYPDSLYQNNAIHESVKKQRQKDINFLAYIRRLIKDYNSHTSMADKVHTYHIINETMFNFVEDRMNYGIHIPSEERPYVNTISHILGTYQNHMKNKGSISNYLSALDLQIQNSLTAVTQQEPSNTELKSEIEDYKKEISDLNEKYRWVDRDISTAKSIIKDFLNDNNAYRESFKIIYDILNNQKINQKHINYIQTLIENTLKERDDDSC